jgi:hypothetical protein
MVKGAYKGAERLLTIRNAATGIFSKDGKYEFLAQSQVAGVIEGRF